MPAKFTCDGAQVSPELSWEVESSDIKSFALVMDDPDGIPIVGYSWVHWDVYQIPATARQIPEGATATTNMPSGSVEGRNNDDLAKYSGPCPPMGTGVHRYVFALYALNTQALNIATNTPLNRSAFERKYAKEIIQKVEISTYYSQ